MTEKLCIDEVLSRYVGEFGPAQWIHFSISSMAWAFEALHTLVTIFADRTPATSCSSICDGVGCGWDNPTISTTSEFNLVCRNAYKVGLAQSLFFVGALIGAGVFGSLADSIAGRKGGLRIACLASGVLGLATASSPNYWVYAALRMLTGAVSVGGIGLCSFVLSTEPIGVSRRGAVGMSTLYFFSLGTMVLVLMAKLTSSSSWRTLYVVTSIPSLLYSVAVLPLVHESPRWLLVRGERDKAMHVMRSLAKLNGNSVPDNVVLSTEMEEDHESEMECASGTLSDVFRQPRLRVRIVIMVVIWFACSLVYYGVSLNVGNIGYNLYMSVLLNAVVELPAFAITALLLGSIGRRGMLLGSMFLSGICCCIGSVCFGLLSKDNVSIIGLVCGALGIFGMAGAYNLVFIYTSELFPTVVRNAALGLASQAGQVGAIAAPLIVQMAGLHPALPFGVFAFAAIAGGLLSAWLPETLNQPLFDTLQGILEGSNRKALLE